MNKNFILLFAVVFGVLYLVNYIQQPSQEDLDKYAMELEQYRKDSMAYAEASKAQTLKLDSLAQLKESLDSNSYADALENLKTEQLKSTLGAFYPAGQGQENTFTIESNQLKLTFSNKGGRLIAAEVKDFLAYDHATEDRYDKKQLVLFDNKDNKFEYFIPAANVLRGEVSTADLFFDAKQEGNTIRFIAKTEDPNKYFEQVYTLEDNYTIKYNVNAVGLKDILPASNSKITLNWTSLLNKVEKSPSYERNLASVHFKTAASNDVDYCNCTATAQETPKEALKWISHHQQFFNMTLIGLNTTFSNAQLSTEVPTDIDATPYLKALYTKADLAINNPNENFQFQFYVGPTDYENLTAIGEDLKEIIPFGWSIFGLIGEYFIRPIFNVLATFLPNYGVIIILLTLLIRVALYPMQYKLLLSGVKTSLLRPEMEALRAKHGDNKQALQMEQMKLYQQYGANPMAGCLPMLFTMPIWISLYRFFPASIEFRQKPFLWADDLASFDSVLDLSFSIPFYGDHVSLFTLLWVISMIAFVKYNSAQMQTAPGADPQQMKMMMIMQYAFPFIFFFPLNSWASGLTVYMLFSNLLNMAQTYITKNWIINKDKVRAEMEAVKNNPKPKSKWQEQLEQMQKQMQEQQQNKKK